MQQKTPKNAESLARSVAPYRPGATGWVGTARKLVTRLQSSLKPVETEQHPRGTCTRGREPWTGRHQWLRRRGGGKCARDGGTVDARSTRPHRRCGNGVLHDTRARNAISTRLNLLNSRAGGVEVGLGERDLVVRKIVYDVRRAQEGVTEHGDGVAGGPNAEDANRHTTADGGGDDELVVRHGDGDAAEAKVQRAVLVGEVAVDEGGLLARVVAGVEALVQRRGDVVGEVHERGARVEQDWDVGVGEERGLVVADAHVGQGDDELGVGALLLQDGQGGERAVELVCVDAAEEDAAGGGVEVVEPQRVGVAADGAVVLELLR